jgi:hypothetical protein
MSSNTFEKALKLAKKCKNYEILGNVKPEKIKEAEKLLSLTFSKQHFEYYSKVGLLSFYGSEFYGMSNREFSGLPGSNAILLAIADRKEYDLNTKWVPIYFFGDGYMAYLDYSQLNSEGEPAIIMAIYNGDEYIVTEKVAEDLGDFLLQLVEEQLANQ